MKTPRRPRPRAALLSLGAALALGLGPGPADAAPPAGATRKVLVQDLQARGVEGHEAAALSTAACNALAKRKDLEVLCGDDLRAMVKWNTMAATFNACADDACAASTARALSAALVVSGSVAKVGPGLVLSLAMIDVARGEPVGRAEVKAADVGALYAQVPEAVDILLAPKKR